MENLRTAFKTSDKLGKVVMLTGRKAALVRLQTMIY